MSRFEASSYAQTVPFIKALYDRIPKPALTSKDTFSYLRRLERLKLSCESKLQCRIHYPSQKQQIAAKSLQNFIVMPDFSVKRYVGPNDDNYDTTLQLDPKRDLLVKQKRADAIIIYTSESCRTSGIANILNNDHYEILFVISFSRDVAVGVLDALLDEWKTTSFTKAVFAEVPQSWDAFFTSGGFKQYPYATFGNLLPKHSFLHTWVLNDLDEWKSVSSVMGPTIEQDLKFPADPDIKDVKIPIVETGLLFSPEAYPSDISQATVRFNEDYRALLNFGRNVQGKINVEDAANVKQVMQRMFAFAQLVAKNEQWNQTIDVERMFADFGVEANPSTQTMYNDLVQRNDAAEMLANVLVMRSFASMFPRFTSQQIDIEARLLQPLMDSTMRTQSRKWIVANLSEAKDFAALNPYSTDTLKEVQGRMMQLRSSWRGHVQSISRSVSMLENELKGRGGAPNAPEVTPIVVLQKRAAQIIQTAKEMETEYQHTLERVGTNMVADKAAVLTLLDWKEQSQNNIESLQKMSFDSESVMVTYDAEVPAAQQATALVDSLVATTQNTNTKDDASERTVAGVALQNASPDVNGLDELMAQFNKNLDQLKAVEKQRKREIRTKMRDLASLGVGARQDIKKLAETQHVDMTTKSQAERKEIIDLARGCDLQLQASISNPIFQENPDAEKESLISEENLIQLHNLLVSQTNCLTRYYDSMQLLEKKIEHETGSIVREETHKTIQTLIALEKKADIAITEARLLQDNVKTAKFVSDVKAIEDGVALMIANRTEMTKLHQQINDTLQPNAVSQLSTADRKQILESANELLVVVVSTLLEMKQNIISKTEQFRLLNAALESNKNLSNALKQSQESARVAAAHKKTLELAQLTNNALHEKMAIVASPYRKATASYDNLNEQVQSITQQHQIALMQLSQKLQSDLDQNASDEVIKQDIHKISAYYTRHKQVLQGMDIGRENEDIWLVVQRAKETLGLHKQEYDNASSDWSRKQKKMKHVAELLSNLESAVDNKDQDSARETTEKLRAINFKEVYTPDNEAMNLFANTKHLLME